MPSWEQIVELFGLDKWPLWGLIGILIVLLLLRDTKLLQYFEEKLVQIGIVLARTFRLGAKGLRKKRLQVAMNQVLRNLDSSSELSHRRVALRWASPGAQSVREAERVIIVLPSIDKGSGRLLGPLREFVGLTHIQNLRRYFSDAFASVLDDIACLDLLVRSGKDFEARELGRVLATDRDRDAMLPLLLGTQKAGFWRSIAAPELAHLDQTIELEIAPQEVESDVRDFFGFVGTIARRPLGEEIELRYAGRWLHVLVLIVGKAEKVARGEAVAYISFLSRMLTSARPRSVYVTGPAVNSRVMRNVSHYLGREGYASAEDLENDTLVVAGANRFTIKTRTIAMRLDVEVPKASQESVYVPKPLPEAGERISNFLAVLTHWTDDDAYCRLADHPSVSLRFRRSILVGGRELTSGAPLYCDLVGTGSGHYGVIAAVSIAESEVGQSRGVVVDDDFIVPAEFARQEPLSSLLANDDEAGRALRCFVKYLKADEGYGFLVPAQWPEESVFFGRGEVVVGWGEMSVGAEVLADIRQNDRGPGLKGFGVISLASLAWLASGKGESVALTRLQPGEYRAVFCLLKYFNEEQNFGFLTPASNPEDSVYFAGDAVVAWSREREVGDHVIADFRSNDIDGGFRATSVFFVSALVAEDGLSDLLKTPTKFPADAILSGQAGYVRSFAAPKSLGFIAPSEAIGESVFFHLDRCVNPPKQVRRGMPVIFDAIRNDSGDLQASGVAFVRVEVPRYPGDELPSLYETPSPIALKHEPPLAAGELVGPVVGLVKHYNVERGFGFVSPVGSPSVDYFFRYKDWLGPTGSPIKGELVSFMATLSPDGNLQARSVEMNTAPAWPTEPP